MELVQGPALSEMYTKSCTSGAQISSYLDASSIAVTPTSCDNRRTNTTTSERERTERTQEIRQNAGGVRSVVGARES